MKQALLVQFRKGLGQSFNYVDSRKNHVAIKEGNPYLNLLPSLYFITSSSISSGSSGSTSS